MIKLIQDNIGDNVLAFSLHGTIRHEDYTEVLVPALEQKIAGGRKVRVLVVFAPDFTGYSAEAVWDDAKVGFRHLSAFERVAVVTDVNWVEKACKFFGFLVPCPVKVFPRSELAPATAWLAA